MPQFPAKPEWTGPGGDNPLPPLAARAAHFVKAMGRKYWARPERRYVAGEQFLVRLAECDRCCYRTVDDCSLCGCPCWDKAKLATETCPDKRWPIIGG